MRMGQRNSTQKEQHKQTIKNKKLGDWLVAHFGSSKGACPKAVV
jgi:hypothetical protein